jgi:hypothetical protein
MDTGNRRFSDADKVDELQREIKMRNRVFPRWVADGRMRQDEADRRIAILQEIADEYDSRQRLI